MALPIVTLSKRWGKLARIYRGHCFPPAIISQAVRWYFRYSLTFRDNEELLLERSVVVSVTARGYYHTGCESA
ncbi:transposase-like protein [Robbsia andropogonis]